MKKILKKIITVTMAVISLLIPSFGIKSYATTKVENVQNLYAVESCEKYLKYKGKAITTTYVVYKGEDVEYPAYCLNVNLPGVGEVGSYNVSTEEKITDVGLWRVIINGYPYKTLQELGVDTKEEAYTATKQAIYCYLYNRGAENYSANGDKGINTLQALNTILDNASKETLSQVANNVYINPDSDSWSIDDINAEYISKIYSIKADATISNYEITSDDLPEGAIIVDTSNNEKSLFNQDEKFKVLIPVQTLRNSGNFTLNVETKINTKPVIYGKTLVQGTQDYALTAYSYEDAVGSYNESYEENETKIKIIKKDKDTNELLSNVEFEILDFDKNIIYSNLVTNEEGEITVENVIPGKYYIKEVNPLQGYENYSQLLDIEVSFNEIFTVTINNAKVPEEEPEEPDQKNVNVTNEVVISDSTKEESNKQITNVTVKLPVTGM